MLVNKTKQTIFHPSTELYSVGENQYLSVRVAKVEDVSGILEIERNCYNGETPWNQTALLHELQFNSNAYYQIMYLKDRPIAFIGSWFVAYEAHITNLAVHPEFRNKGIATFLLKEIIRIANLKEMQLVSLEVRASNQEAQNLYKNLLFKEVGVKRKYYSSDQEDAVEMSLRLDEISNG